MTTLDLNITSEELFYGVADKFGVDHSLIDITNSEIIPNVGGFDVKVAVIEPTETAHTIVGKLLHCAEIDIKSVYEHLKNFFDATVTIDAEVPTPTTEAIANPTDTATTL